MVITLKDIARQAGVSTTTVSRILNGRESGVPIRDETRQRVVAIAAELNYQPNMMARALRGSPSSLIGVLAQNVTNLLHGQILRGMNEAAVKRAYRVFLGHVERQVNSAVDYGSMFEHAHADGIVIVGEFEGDGAALDQLARKHRQVVSVGACIPGRKFPGVYTDSAVGTRLALDHLWGLGHRRIVCVTDPHLYDGRFRAEIYQRFMSDHGLEHVSRVLLTARSFQASCDAGRDIFADFRQADCPTAIFAATDTIAIGLMQAAFQAGVSIPDQASIVGFDDIDFAPFTIPPLTTIRQSGIELGRVAANLLLDMIEQGRESSEVADVVLTPSLVVRQSTTPPSLSS